MSPGDTISALHIAGGFDMGPTVYETDDEMWECTTDAPMETGILASKVHQENLGIVKHVLERNPTAYIAKLNRPRILDFDRPISFGIELIK